MTAKRPDSEEQLRAIESALTSVRHEFIYRNHKTAPKSLIAALQQEFPRIPGDTWPARLAIGGAYVNGHPATGEQALPNVPFRIEYYDPKDGAHDVLYKTLEPAWIVHEDKELIAINKPPGLSCNQAREQHSSHLRKLVEDYLGRQAHLPSRLDTSARGLVVISTAARTHKLLQQVYERHEVEKYYLLAVSPPIKWKNKLVENRLDRDPRHAVLRKVVTEGGDQASTFFKKVADADIAGNPCSIVLAKPRTGRTHQLRVQMSTLGHPIVGDKFYNGIPSSELHLLSVRIRFFDRTRKEFREFALRPQDLPGWAKPEWIITAERSPPA